MSELYSDEELDKARSIGKAEGIAEGHEQGLREAKIAGAGREEGKAAGFKQGHEEGAAAYRERCRLIMTSPAARGREKAAEHLALETDIDAEAAIGALATMRTQSAIGARAASTFAAVDPITLQ